MYGVTATVMKLKFPEFADVDGAALELAIEEASRNVDDTWLEGDRKLALLYLSAHYISVSQSRASNPTGQQIASERIGEISVSYVQTQQSKSTDDSDIGSTLYGARYLELAKLNFPSVMVI